MCAILDAFHFPLPTELDEAQLAAEAAEAAALAAQEAAAAQLAAAEAAEGAAKGKEEEEEQEDAEMEEAGEAGEEEAADGEELPDAAAAAAAGAAGAGEAAGQAVPAGEVYRMLSKRVVPELQRIMVSKDTVRAPVALAGALVGGWACRAQRCALPCTWGWMCGWGEGRTWWRLCLQGSRG